MRGREAATIFELKTNIILERWEAADVHVVGRRDGVFNRIL